MRTGIAKILHGNFEMVKRVSSDRHSGGLGRRSDFPSPYHHTKMRKTSSRSSYYPSHLHSIIRSADIPPGISLRSFNNESCAHRFPCQVKSRKAEQERATRAPASTLIIIPRLRVYPFAIYADTYVNATISPTTDHNHHARPATCSRRATTIRRRNASKCGELDACV